MRFRCPAPASEGMVELEGEATEPLSTESMSILLQRTSEAKGESRGEEVKRRAQKRVSKKSSSAIQVQRRGSQRHVRVAAKGNQISIRRPCRPCFLTPIASLSRLFRFACEALAPRVLQSIRRLCMLQDDTRAIRLGVDSAEPVVEVRLQLRNSRVKAPVGCEREEGRR